MTVGRETKVGLLVGIIFIGLFGLILGGRAGSATQEHAALPVGESKGHGAMARTIHRTIDPFAQDETLDIHGPDTTPASDDAVTGAEPLPVPESLPFKEPEFDDSAEPAEPAGADDFGLVAFLPETVKTPMGDPTPGGGEAEDAGGQIAFTHEPPPAPAEQESRPVHTVRRGQTLTAIAREHYGKDGQRLWRRIWEANKAAVSDPHRLAQGQKLVIPKLPVRLRPAMREAAIAKAPEAAPSDASDHDGAGVVTAEEVGQMLGNRSDLLERQTKPPAMYKICKGDTFYRIATNLYGDGRLARLLFLKNRHLVADETKLQIGQRIVLLDGARATPAPDLRIARR